MLNNGYYITAELKVKDPSKVRITREALTILCDKTLTEPGCSMFTAHVDLNQPTRFLLWECFEDEAAFKAHFEAQHTKEYVALDLTELVQFFQTSLA